MDVQAGVSGVPPGGTQPDLGGPVAQPHRSPQQNSPVRSAMKRTASGGAGVGGDVSATAAALERTSLKCHVKILEPAPPSPENKTHGGALFAGLAGSSSPPSPEGNGDEAPPPPAHAAAWNWATGRASSLSEEMQPYVTPYVNPSAVLELPPSVVLAAPGPEEATHAADADRVGTQDG